jgi:hypothetical protein
MIIKSGTTIYIYILSQSVLSVKSVWVVPTFRERFGPHCQGYLRPCNDPLDEASIYTQLIGEVLAPDWGTGVK